MSGKKGFTLIELLVVIAIIALLASFMVPSLQKAKMLARRTYCLSTLNTLGKTMRMYASDTDGRWLPFNNQGSWSSYSGYWCSRIRVAMLDVPSYQSGITDQRVFESRSGRYVLCADDPLYRKNPSNWNFHWNLDAYSSYAINQSACGPYNWGGSLPAIIYGPKIEEIQRPGDVVLLMDSGPRYYGTNIPQSFVTTFGDGVMDINIWHGAFGGDNHAGLANTLYMDTHAVPTSLLDVDYDPSVDTKVMRWWGREPYVYSWGKVLPDWFWWIPRS